MIGYGELMTDLEELRPRGRRFLSVIMRSAERELRLVDDLLTLVTIEESGLAIRSAEIDLEAVVRDAVEATRPRAEEAELEVSLETPGVGVPMYGDQDRLGQAMDNLLSNAIKFTPRGGRVKRCCAKWQLGGDRCHRYRLRIGAWTPTCSSSGCSGPRTRSSISRRAPGSG